VQPVFDAIAGARFICSAASRSESCLCGQ
jgi:hypothetical protein